MAIKQIPVAVLIGYFQQMLKERWAYVASAAERGKVDCSGALVWAFKQEQHSIYHGSNRIAREEVERLLPVSGTVIVPGMVAFKHRKPGDAGYALPDSYKPGGSHYNGDLNDYYHVGLVDEDTARVLNAQSAATGFVASPISQNWSHVAFLKQVDYSAYYQPGTPDVPDVPETDITPESPSTSGGSTGNVTTATVYAENGKPVKMRSKPSTTCNLYWPVPHGATVTVRGAQSGKWVPIAYDGHTGYMMAEFLRMGGNGAVSSPNTPTTPDTSASGESYSSYAIEFYDLTLEQARALQDEIPRYKSRIEGRNG